MPKFALVANFNYYIDLKKLRLSYELNSYFLQNKNLSLEKKKVLTKIFLLL
jgi:hypothetical protein